MLLNRDTLLTESTPQEFATARGFRMLTEDNVAANPSIAFSVEKPKPAIATLKQDVLAKYGSQFTYDSTHGWETITWLFDAKRQLISGATAKSKNIENAPGVPRVVKPSDGINLNVAFKGGVVTNQIAESLMATLVDGNALYKSVEETKAAYRR